MLLATERRPLKISIILSILALTAGVAAAAPHHPLSQIYPMDVDLNLSGQDINEIGDLRLAGSSATVGGSLNLQGSINMSGNEIVEYVTDARSGAPTSPAAGQMWFDTGQGVLKYYNGTNWVVTASADSISSDLQSVLSSGNSAGSYNINMSGQDITGITELKDTTGYNRIRFLDTTTQINTPGGGSESVLIRDTANSQPITEFQEGGNVIIPNGELDMNRNMIRDAGSARMDVGWEYLGDDECGSGTNYAHRRFQLARVTGDGDIKSEYRIFVASDDNHHWVGVYSIMMTSHNGENRLTGLTLNHISGKPGMLQVMANETQVWLHSNGKWGNIYYKAHSEQQGTGAYEMLGKTRCSDPSSMDIDTWKNFYYNWDSNSKNILPTSSAGGDLYLNNAWMDSNPAEYGNFRIGGGPEKNYVGINLEANQDWTLMGNTGSNYVGLYDDTEDQWIYRMHNEEFQAWYNGGIRLETKSYGINVNIGSCCSQGIKLDGRTALTSGSSNGWLRLNQDSEFSSGTYTPDVIRADDGFHVDGNTIIDSSGDLRRQGGLTKHRAGYITVSSDNNEYMSCTGGRSIDSWTWSRNGDYDSGDDECWKTDSNTITCDSPGGDNDDYKVWMDCVSTGGT